MLEETVTAECLRNSFIRRLIRGQCKLIELCVTAIMANLHTAQLSIQIIRQVSWQHLQTRLLVNMARVFNMARVSWQFLTIETSSSQDETEASQDERTALGNI